jgi:hypothetical protein
MESSPQQQQLSHDEIARQAYLLWEQRGCPQGCDVEFWLEAERQILSAGKPNREQFTASARSPDALSVQSQPSQTAAKSASPVRSRTNKQAATMEEDKVKQSTPRTSIPALRQTKPAPRAAAHL